MNISGKSTFYEILFCIHHLLTPQGWISSLTEFFFDFINPNPTQPYASQTEKIIFSKSNTTPTISENNDICLRTDRSSWSNRGVKNQTTFKNIGRFQPHSYPLQNNKKHAYHRSSTLFGDVPPFTSLLHTHSIRFFFYGVL